MSEYRGKIAKWLMGVQASDIPGYDTYTWVRYIDSNQLALLIGQQVKWTLSISLIYVPSLIYKLCIQCQSFNQMNVIAMGDY